MDKTDGKMPNMWEHLKEGLDFLCMFWEAGTKKILMGDNAINFEINEANSC